MADAKHTPGPWTAHQVGVHPSPYVCGPSVPTEYGEDQFVVAYMVGMNTEANSRLVAAAPELLEALTDCVALLEVIKEDWVDYDHVFSTGVHDAKAAIAKAITSQAYLPPQRQPSLR
jgi:hypothetical protein